MEGLVFLFIVIFFVVFVSRFLSERSSESKVAQSREEFLRDREYEINRKLAKLSSKQVKIIVNLRASEVELRYAKKLGEDIARLEKEYEPIRQELAEIKASKRAVEKQDMKEAVALLDKHEKLVELLVSRKNCTEEQASMAIFNNLARRQQKYQNDGLSKDDALKKANAEIYGIVDRVP